jgi:hypothetical protein
MCKPSGYVIYAKRILETGTDYLLTTKAAVLHSSGQKGVRKRERDSRRQRSWQHRAYGDGLTRRDDFEETFPELKQDCSGGYNLLVEVRTLS